MRPNRKENEIMRTLIIESIEQGESEIKTEVVKDIKAMFMLIDLGMNISDLLENDNTEFLTQYGAQYRVTLCDIGTFACISGGNA